jgi:hypothetical protein
VIDPVYHAEADLNGYFCETYRRSIECAGRLVTCSHGGAQGVRSATMSDPDRDRRRFSAERLSHVLREHGIGPPARPIMRYMLIGFVAGAAVGLLVGWLIWG